MRFGSGEGRWAWLPVFAACSFGGSGQNVPIDAAVDAAIDTYIVDSGICPNGHTIECISESVVRECTMPGVFPEDETCFWGCTSADPRCRALQPTTNAITEQDLGGNLTIVTLSAPTTFNTETGAISGGFTRGQGTGNDATGVVFQKRGNNSIGMFQFGKLVIDAPVTVVGTSSLALVATNEMIIRSSISMQGACGGTAPGPGGHPGGAARANALGNGAGSSGGTDNLDSQGGGGGGHGGVGGTGGGSSTPPIDAGVDAPIDAPAFTAIPAVGGPAFGTPTIGILEGGGGGGGGGGSGAGPGGGGGGAIHLAANRSIEITVDGSINGGGCGGKGGTSDRYGGGGAGGAGGTIVIEAAVVKIFGQLATNGGGGGGGAANGTPGGNGQLGRTGATGGAGTPGGTGGAGATANGGTGTTDPANSGGGGGGAVGRMRFNTHSGQIVVGGVLSPAIDEPGTTAGTATIR